MFTTPISDDFLSENGSQAMMKNHMADKHLPSQIRSGENGV